MRKLSLVFVLVFLTSMTLSAQVTVQEEITTDSVDLFAPQEKSSKSASVAMYSSLLVPGLGHYYLGHEKAALAYFTADIVAVFGLVFLREYSQKLASNSMSYASINAGASGGAGADEKYWQAVGNSLDLEGYNRVQDLNRTPDQKYTLPNLSWRWADQSLQDEYNKMRKNSERFKIAASFCAGAMVLDRIISYVEMRAATRNGTTLSSFLPQPSFAYDLSKVSLTFSSKF